jgi:hypothetical protein
MMNILFLHQNLIRPVDCSHAYSVTLLAPMFLYRGATRYATADDS